MFWCSPGLGAWATFIFLLDDDDNPNESYQNLRFPKLIFVYRLETFRHIASLFFKKIQFFLHWVLFFNKDLKTENKVKSPVTITQT